MPRPSIPDLETISREKFLNTLAESYILQDAILGATELSVISTDVNGIINSFNAGAAKLLGYDSHEIIGQTTPALLHDNDEIVKRSKELSEELGYPVKPGFETFVAKAKHTRKADRREWTYIRKNGERFPVVLSVSGIWNENNELTGYLGIATDITEQKVAEKQLQESEHKFRLLAENIPGVIYLCRNDATYSMIYLNEEVKTLTGYSSTDFLDNKINFVQLYHPGDIEHINSSVAKAIAVGEKFHLQYRIHHRSGEWRWIDEVGVGVYSDDKLMGLEGFLRDITDQKAAEEELQKISNENNRVFNYSITLNAVAGFDGYFKKLNPIWENIFGWTLEELKSKPFLDFVHPADRKATQEAAFKLSQGQNITTFDNRYLCKDGSYRWLIWNASSDPARQLIYASSIDFTERKKFEEQLFFSKINLEAAAEELQEQNYQLNEFAHIISHNLRSPVGNISALISLLDSKSTLEDYKNIFDKLNATSGNLQATLNDLMETLRIKKEKMIDHAPLLFEEIFTKTTQDLTGEIIQSAADITVDFSAAPTVIYSKTYLESIFLNLLSNALKYRSPKRSPKIHFKTTISQDKMQLEVSDNGLGIDLEKHGHKLFGLRKTFHEHREARGVGLFLTKTQVEALGGKIWVTSEVDKGTSFFIQF